MEMYRFTFDMSKCTERFDENSNLVGITVQLEDGFTMDIPAIEGNASYDAYVKEKQRLQSNEGV